MQVEQNGLITECNHLSAIICAQFTSSCDAVYEPEYNHSRQIILAYLHNCMKNLSKWLRSRDTETTPITYSDNLSATATGASEVASFASCTICIEQRARTKCWTSVQVHAC
eukprot:2912-Heterococcus_DN1.PRE.1